MLAFLERWQAALYFAAIAAGALFSGAPLAWVVEPFLALLLFTTFMSMPLRHFGIDKRFAAAGLILNFVLVPLVVWPMSALVDAPAVRTAVLLVLLAPCIDYVVVFTGLAGGSAHKLAAITPMLLAGQMGFVLGPIEDIGPILRAFIVIIVLPLCLAWAAQRMPPRYAQKIHGASKVAMIPLVMAVLFAIVASYSAGLLKELETIAPVIVVYAAFILVMLPVGYAVSRAFRCSPRDQVALIFSGVTRNSLVILPIAVALPTGFEAVPILIVAQTIVELLAMVLMVKIVPYAAGLHSGNKVH